MDLEGDVEPDMKRPRISRSPRIHHPDERVHQREKSRSISEVGLNNLEGPRISSAFGREVKTRLRPIFSSTVQVRCAAAVSIPDASAVCFNDGFLPAAAQLVVSAPHAGGLEHAGPISNLRFKFASARKRNGGAICLGVGTRVKRLTCCCLFVMMCIIREIASVYKSSAHS